MKITTLTILFFIVCAPCFSQVTDTTLARLTSYLEFDIDTFTLRRKKGNEDLHSQIFEQQGFHYSTYITFKTDSTFEFKHFSPGNVFLSIGKWKSVASDTIRLVWDRNLTIKASEAFKKRKKGVSSIPIWVPILDWTFVRNLDYLIPTRPHSLE